MEELSVAMRGKKKRRKKKEKKGRSGVLCWKNKK